jgi:hypothetical protein
MLYELTLAMGQGYAKPDPAKVCISLRPRNSNREGSGSKLAVAIPSGAPERPVERLKNNKEVPKEGP